MFTYADVSIPMVSRGFLSLFRKPSPSPVSYNYIGTIGGRNGRNGGTMLPSGDIRVRWLCVTAIYRRARSAFDGLDRVVGGK